MTYASSQNLTYQDVCDILKEVKGIYRAQAESVTGISSKKRLETLENIANCLEKDVMANQPSINYRVVPISLSIEQIAESVGATPAKIKAYLRTIQDYTRLKYSLKKQPS